MTPHVHLALELEAGSDPIRGSLGPPGEDGDTRHFDGYVQLISHVEFFRGRSSGASARNPAGSDAPEGQGT